MSDLPRMVNHHNYHVSPLSNSTGAPLNPKSVTSSDQSIVMGSSPTPHHHNQQAQKVQVVYYLSRSGHLEHPHLLEISLSPKVEGLYLRDVKKKLAMIRGKRLPSAFAWSYKRSYKNGYVWQDLCDDDLIYPAHGCEYVLKGSEIITETAHQNAIGDNDADREDAAVQEQKLRARAVNQDSGTKLQGHLAQSSSKSNANGISAINAKAIDSNNHAVINGFQSTETETSDEEVGSHAWKPLPSSNSSSSNSSCNNNNKKKLIDGGLTTSTGPPGTTAPVYYHHHRMQKTAMILVESGTDAATQTDEEVQNHGPSTSASEGSTSSSSQAGVVDSSDHHGTKPAPETKTIHPFSGMLNTDAAAAADIRAGAHREAVQERAIISSSSKNAGSITAASPPSPVLSSARSCTVEATAAAMCSNADASMSPLRKASCGRLSLHPAASNNGNYNNNNTSSESEPSSARPPRSCKALSLLHLVSCGGLDVKEQILPAMSLTYHLKSASSSAPFKPSSSPNLSSNSVKPEQQLCTAEALGYGTPQAPKASSSWKGAAASANMATAPKAKSSTISSHNIESYPEYNSGKGGISSCVSSPISSLSSGLRSSLFNQSRDHAATTCSTPRSLADSEAAVLPDVISLSRSSISDRSTNVSRELDYQTPRKHDKSGSSPSTLRQHIINGRDQPHLPECSPRTGNCRRAVSGEIFRGSPLFVPSSSASPLSSTVAGASTSSIYYSQHQSLHNRAASMSFRQPAAGAPAPSPAATERPLMRADGVQGGNNINLHNPPVHKVNTLYNSNNSKLNDSNGPIAVQQLWQDLSASAAAAADGSSPSIIKDSSRHPVALEGTWDQQWERTLQNAIDLSLPPMELLVLHECPRCNRKLKPELLKAHSKTCTSSPLYINNATTSNLSNMMMMVSKASSPRPQKVAEGSLYQRFLKAPPPPKA